MRIGRLHVGLGLVVAGLVAIGILVSPESMVSRTRAIIQSPWFPVVLIGLYAVRPLLAWPITALSVVVGYKYGLVAGVPIALTGGVATSLVPYVVARHARTDVGILGWATAGSERFFGATGDLRGVIAARLAPTPAEVISVAAGAGRVSTPAFILGTAIGEFPWTVAAVLAGHSMHRLTLSGVETLDPALIVGGGGATVLLLAGPAYRAVRTWQEPPVAGE